MLIWCGTLCRDDRPGRPWFLFPLHFDGSPQVCTNLGHGRPRAIAPTGAVQSCYTPHPLQISCAHAFASNETSAIPCYCSQYAIIALHLTPK